MRPSHFFVSVIFFSSFKEFFVLQFKRFGSMTHCLIGLYKLDEIIHLKRLVEHD